MKKMKTGIGVMLALLCCILMCTGVVYATGDDTDGTELQVAQPVILEVQLGPQWAGVEFQLKTDVGLYPGTNIPVGTLANRELRTLRNQAHHYFDQLYLSGLMSKQDAYLWLAGLLQVPLSKAHIGFLGEYYCNEVIAESKKLLERRRKQQPAGFRPCKGGEAS